MHGLEQMRGRGELRSDADPAALATATMASLQGGLLLTQVRRDPGQLRLALDGALANLRTAAAPEQPRPSHGRAPGSATIIRQPRSPPLRASIVPPCRSTIDLAMARPRPVPPSCGAVPSPR